jgi:2'-5' RNA ligase
MNTIRSFIAIELHDEVRKAFREFQGRLRAVVPSDTVRWTNPTNIHLTLHFLGDVAVNDLEQVALVIQGVATDHPPFSLHLSNLGCFPNTRRPRIVWVGLEGETETLVAVQHRVGQQLKETIGFQPDRRPYSPHLTIGRVKKGVTQNRLRSLGQSLEKQILRVGRLATLHVDRIHLIQSDLRPDGPVYTSMAHGEFEKR